MGEIVLLIDIAAMIVVKKSDEHFVLLRQAIRLGRGSLSFMPYNNGAASQNNYK